MSKRTVLILFGLVLGLALLALLGQREPVAGVGDDAVFLPGLEEQINDVSRVRVVGPSNTTAATLERTEDGWVVAEKGRYPADIGKIRQALVALGQARILERKTANPELHSRLGVEDVASDAATGTQLVIEGLDEPVSVIIGTAEGSEFRYARRSDEAQSYLIDRDPKLPDDVTGWLELGILDIDAGRIQSVTISHADGETVRIFKESASQDRFTVDELPENRELLYVGVGDAVAGVLRNLRLEDVSPAAETEEEPAFTTEFRAFDGLIVTAMGGGEGEDSWVTFAVRYDAEQAARFAEQPAENEAEAGEESEESADAATPAAAEGEESAETSADSADAPDPQEEASDLAERLSGWRYRIASYQFGQMSKRMENLLKAE